MENVIPWSLSELLPHAPPMILLDKILQIDSAGKTCSCEVRIHAESCFADPVKGVPCYVGVEYMAQTVGVLAGYLQKEGGAEAMSLGFLLTADIKYQKDKWYPLGTILQVRVERDWGEGMLMRVEAKITESQTDTILTEALLSVFSPNDPKAFLEEAMS